MEYKIIFASNEKQLEYRVNERIKQGWSPLGGMSVIPHTPTNNPFYQAMTKPSSLTEKYLSKSDD